MIIFKRIADSEQKSVVTLSSGTISGRLSERKAFREKLGKYWQQAGENPQRRPINILLKDTLFTAIPKDGMLWIRI